jgi:sec-independent protein translocase protein TatA
MNRVTGTARPFNPRRDPENPVRSALAVLKFEKKGHPMIEGLFQPTHLIFLLAIALLIFGPRKLPELGQGLGKGIRGFKDALRGIGDDSQTPGPDKPPEAVK